MLLRIFGVSASVAVVGLAAGLLYGGLAGLLVAAALAVLEVSISFDNAVVNATILQRMSRFWQQLFLTVGVLVAVFGMRLLFPVLLVAVTAGLGPIEAVRLALAKGAVDEPGSYAYLLHEAHPVIAAFGGIFLLMLFLDFVLDGDREIRWLVPVERALGRVGRLPHASVLVAAATVIVAGMVCAPADREAAVLVSGLAGMVSYLLVNGIGRYFESRTEGAEPAPSAPSRVAVATGRAAFFLFLYLEVIDASFSFDGVVGAFAVTSDPVLIAIGLGIGAFFIRSITIYLVRSGSLVTFRYLEHGAMWAIGSLATVLVVSIATPVPEWLPALLSVAFLAAAVTQSAQRNRQDRRLVAAVPDDRVTAGAAASG